MGGVPSKPGDDETQLQVIGAGYSRTGTTSMQLALEKVLNGPVMHGGTHILWREDAFAKKWVQAYEAREAGDKEKTMKLLRELTAGFVGVTDTPNFDFIPELVELYPEAKVVLVTRDPERWWTSIGGNLKYAFPWYLPILTAPMPGLRWFPSIAAHWQRIAKREMGKARGPGTPLSPDLIEVHNEMVKRVVPPERLLVMNLKEGWQPLCKFLDKQVPKEPFPRLNDAEEAEKVAKGIFARCILAWVGIIGATAVGVNIAGRFLTNQNLGFIKSALP